MIEQKKFAKASSNRDLNLDNIKMLYEEISALGMFAAPLVLADSAMVSPDYALFDFFTDEPISNEDRINYYIVADGQHRIAALALHFTEEDYTKKDKDGQPTGKLDGNRVRTNNLKEKLKRLTPERKKQISDFFYLNKKVYLLDNSPSAVPVPRVEPSATYDINKLIRHINKQKAWTTFDFFGNTLSSVDTDDAIYNAAQFTLDAMSGKLDYWPAKLQQTTLGNLLLGDPKVFNATSTAQGKHLSRFDTVNGMAASQDATRTQLEFNFLWLQSILRELYPLIWIKEEGKTGYKVNTKRKKLAGIMISVAFKCASNLCEGSLDEGRRMLHKAIECLPVGDNAGYEENLFCRNVKDPGQQAKVEELSVEEQETVFNNYLVLGAKKERAQAQEIANQKGVTNNLGFGAVYGEIVTNINDPSFR